MKLVSLARVGLVLGWYSAGSGADIGLLLDCFLGADAPVDIGCTPPRS